MSRGSGRGRRLGACAFVVGVVTLTAGALAAGAAAEPAARSLAPVTVAGGAAAGAAAAAAPAAAAPAAAAAAAPAAAAPASVPPPLVPPPTTRLASTARLVAPALVRAAPSAQARAVTRLAPVALWNGGAVRLLVLDSRHVDGSLWLRVRLPSRPNGAAGWIDADVAQLGETAWRVEVDLRARRATALHDGRAVRRWPIVVGLPATQTPRGLFAVYERVRQPAGSELGPWALHLTAHSDVLFDYGGGPGRIALHGRAGALLADPLGSAASHGCVRFDSAAIAWLAARAGPGTPVLIR